MSAIYSPLTLLIDWTNRLTVQLKGRHDPNEGFARCQMPKEASSNSEKGQEQPKDEWRTRKLKMLHTAPLPVASF